jgi:phospholipase/carboxylesterase
MDMDEQTSLNLTHMLRPALERPSAEGALVPGLLLLHGRGADEADLMGLESALDPRLTIVSVRAPFRLGPGFAWYGMSKVGEPDAETLRASVRELDAFIDGLPAAYAIDPARLYLMGFSQGAVMSAAMALLKPEAVRAALLHSGYVPANSGLGFSPEAARGRPFYLAHGKYDDVIPVTFGRDSHEYLEAAGAEVVYHEYPIGHTISEESLYDLAEWLSARLDED